MADFVTKPTMTVKMPLDMTSDSTVAQATDITAATKMLSIAGIKRDANLTQSTGVHEYFAVSIGGGNIDSLGAVRVISEGVSD